MRKLLTPRFISVCLMAILMVFVGTLCSCNSASTKQVQELDQKQEEHVNLSTKIKEMVGNVVTMVTQMAIQVGIAMQATQTVQIEQPGILRQILEMVVGVVFLGGIVWLFMWLRSKKKGGDDSYR